MTWFKVDDNLAFHPKAIAAGNAAMGLWVRLGSYTSAQNLNGFVPDSVAKSLGSFREMKRLLDARLVVEVSGGYMLHDYLDYNPSREKVQADRLAATQRKAKSRARHSDVTAMSRRDTPVTHSDVTPSVTALSQRPDPTRPENTLAPRSQRARNPMWDTLSELFAEPATKTEKTNRGRIIRELTEAGATPDDVRARHAEHSRRRLHWTLTENALVTHWAELAPRNTDGDLSNVLGYRFTGSM